MSWALEEQASLFIKLTERFEIKLFLTRDCCAVIADKYQLAAVFLYFVRANFQVEDFTVRNFFLALFLSHEINEEVEYLKEVILKEILGRKNLKKPYLERFDRERFLLFARMDFNGKIDRKVCKFLFNYIPSRIWRRNRSLKHSGVIVNENVLCKKCRYPVWSALKLSRHE